LKDDDKTNSKNDRFLKDFASPFKIKPEV